MKVTPQNEPNDTVTISELENDKPYTFTAVVTADGKTSREATVKGTPSLANSPVTVTFHSNPPADDLEEQGSYTQVVEVDKETALTLCEFDAYESYEFKGWATSAESKDIVYADGALLKATTEDITSGINLYAVWAGIPLTAASVSSPTGYLIGGTTVVLEEALEPENAYVSRVEVTGDNSGTASYDFATKTLTLPSNGGDASVEYNLTLTYYTVNDSGVETPVSASLSDLTVYPDTWVVFNNTVYKDVQVFDFTDTASLESVRYDSAAISSDAISEEGFTFTVPTDSEKKQVTIPSDGLGTAVLTLIEMKWDKTGANVYIVEGDALYGWSPYKGGDNFMLGRQSNGGGPWNAKVGSSMDISPETGSFNKYFILDDGSNLPTLGFNNDIYVTEQDITNSEGKKITTINPFKITFTVSNTTDVTYTLKTVAFYTTP